MMEYYTSKHNDLKNEECANLHLEEDDGVLEEGAEDEEDAADHPRLHRVQPVRLGRVGRRRVEDVHLRGGARHATVNRTAVS